MKVYGCQLDIVWEDKRANYLRVRKLIGGRNPEAGSLFVLPEMFSTGFSMNVPAVQERVPSETETFLQQLAIEFRIYVMGGLVDKESDGEARNQAVVYSPEGRLLTRYSKVHPFTLGGEAACYRAGTELSFFDWAGMRAALFICYDLRFPEIFRSAVRAGAQLFIVIANWPVKRAGHWVTLLQARAIENQAYVVGVNRSGTDPKFTYPGCSMVVDPHGNVVAELGKEEGIIEATVDLLEVESWRKEFPALQDMHWKGI